MSSNFYDVIIVGAGPIGLACGIEAVKAGLTHVLLEEGTLVNSIYKYPANMTFFSTSDRLEIGDVPFISHGSKPTRNEALEYYRRVKYAWNLNTKMYEPVLEIKPAGTCYSTITSRNTYTSKYIILATGFYGKPNMMNIPGEELSKVLHYYNDAHPYIDQKVLVAGGGNSAVDAALETYRKGAEVTLVTLGPAIDEGVKYWIKPDIENRIKEVSIKAYFNSKPKEIRIDEVDIETPDGVISIKNDFVLAMTGYQPDFSFLIKIGINLSEDKDKIPNYNPDSFETNLPNVFLAGVVCGGMQTGKLFIENSRIHAKNIFDHIRSKSNTPI